MTKIINIFLFFFILGISSSWALPGHDDEKHEKIIIDGTLLLEEEGESLPWKNGGPAALMVFHQGKEILKLNKNTDGEGRFQFRNIIKNEEYFYLVGTFYEEEAYIAFLGGPDLMNVDQSFQIKILVGPNSPYKVDMEHLLNPEKANAPQQKGAKVKQKKPIIVSLSLVGFILLFSLYWALQKPQKTITEDSSEGNN